jgi:phosphoribosyl 1,2-cyclic phosphodiesterase
MRVVALASGSSGNAYLVQAGGTAILVDAGVSLTSLEAGLDAVSVAPSGIASVLLTHEHSDHMSSAAAFSRRHGAPLVGTAGTLRFLRGRIGEQLPVSSGHSFRIRDLTVTPFAVPHDSAEPVGYLIEHGGTSVCLATDLGHVPPDLLPIFGSSSLLVIEANHDLQRLWRGPYPRFLKTRVAATTGHLSNDQTGDCLVSCADGKAKTVWLAHLSDTNNSPRCALDTVQARLRQEGIDNLDLRVALRDRRSLAWSSEEGSNSQARLL